MQGCENNSTVIEWKFLINYGENEDDKYEGKWENEAFTMIKERVISDCIVVK